MNLEKGAVHCKAIFVRIIFRMFKNITNRSWNNSSKMMNLARLKKTLITIRTKCCESFSRACLAVGENSAIIAGYDRFCAVFNTLININLWCTFVENPIEFTLNSLFFIFNMYILRKISQRIKQMLFIQYQISQKRPFWNLFPFQSSAVSVQILEWPRFFLLFSSVYIY